MNLASLRGSGSLGWLLGGLLLGLLLAFPLASLGMAGSPTARLRRGAEDSLVARLEQEQDVLRQGVEARRQLLAQVDEQAAGQSLMLGELEAELAQNRVLAGLTEVQGPGVVVTLADGDLASAGEEPDLAIIHDYDLVDVLNALWGAGAEVISVNGDRIVFGSYVYCVGSTIIVGDRRLSPPLALQAVGDRQRMAAMLAQDPELEGLRQRASLGSVTFKVEGREDIVCPPYSGAIQHRFARAGD